MKKISLFTNQYKFNFTLVLSFNLIVNLVRSFFFFFFLSLIDFIFLLFVGKFVKLNKKLVNIFNLSLINLYLS